MATTIATSESRLPPLTSPRILELGLSDFPDCSDAYEIILQAEEHAISQQSKGDVISARVTGYLLLEFCRRSHIIGGQPCASLVRLVTSSIHGESQHDVVFHVGKLHCCKLIHLFRPLNVEYPPPSPQPSSPFFDGLEDMMEDSVEAAGKDYGTLRKKVLARDGYQCMVTGLFDTNSLHRCVGLQDIARHSGKSGVPIETAYILKEPESTLQGSDLAMNIEDGAATNETHHAADILESFGFSKLAETFKQPGGINQAWNLLSLQHDFHYKFDALRLWFESTDQLGHYEVCTFDEGEKGFICSIRRTPELYASGAPIIVDLESHCQEIPPPNPTLLTLHAICAQVAHMSGVAGVFDQLEWEAEEDVGGQDLKEWNVHFLPTVLSDNQ